MVTETQEDYLRAMYHLWEDNKQVAHIKHIPEINIKSSEVAEYLNVTKPTVSKMMFYLKGRGYVNYSKYGKLKFTKKGQDRAKDLTAKHRIIELFLKDMLEIDDKKLHQLAHKLEHAFDDECIDKLHKMLGNPSTDPHGKHIPR